MGIRNIDTQLMKNGNESKNMITKKMKMFRLAFWLEFKILYANKIKKQLPVIKIALTDPTINTL